MRNFKVGTKIPEGFKFSKQKSDKTIMMEIALMHSFEKLFNIRLRQEFNLKKFGSPRKRADLAGKIVDYDNEEILDLIIIEIKVAQTDFHTSCGMNFIGSSNYLAVPSELVGYAIEFLRENDLDYVGVLEVTEKGLVRFVTFPKNHVNEYIRDCGIIWQMIEPLHLRKNRFVS